MHTRKMKYSILLIIFITLFVISVLCDGLIFYDFFDPCRISMDTCGESFTFNLVHSKYFFRGLMLENLFNIITSIIVIYRSKKNNKNIFIILGIISIFTTFSLWLILMGEVGIIFS